jgi:outer membrane receptor protein involved in Fe transport
VRFETTAQWQRHGLTEVSDDCVPAPGQTTCTKVKDRPAFGLVLNTGTVDVMMHAASGAHLNSTIGVSGMYQSNSTTGPIFLIPSATTTNAAAFALEEATFGPLSVVGGARADARSLSADATSALQLNADDRSWSATSGNLGFVLRPVSALALVANVGTGWRAPTLFDLYANGPNLADARYEIGSPTLKTERAVNLDGGLRWETNRARAELSVYQNTVDNFIYTSRTPQTVNALRVYRHIQTDARLTGAELSGEVSVTEPLSLHASYDMVRGTDRTADQPLELMPAPRAILGADLHTTNLSWARRASIGAALEINQRQTRLNPNDFPTDGYTLLNVNLGMERMVRARPVRFDVSVRNALNTSYHDYLSRYKEFAVGQGVNVILKASTGAW